MARLKMPIDFNNLVLLKRDPVSTTMTADEDYPQVGSGDLIYTC